MELESIEKSPSNKPDVIPVSGVPGLTDPYTFVAWLKANRYHIRQPIRIQPENGGLIRVTFE